MSPGFTGPAGATATSDVEPTRKAPMASRRRPSQRFAEFARKKTAACPSSSVAARAQTAALARYARTVGAPERLSERCATIGERAMPSRRLSSREEARKSAEIHAYAAPRGTIAAAVGGRSAMETISVLRMRPRDETAEPKEAGRSRSTVRTSEERRLRMRPPGVASYHAIGAVTSAPSARACIARPAATPPTAQEAECARTASEAAARMAA